MFLIMATGIAVILICIVNDMKNSQLDDKNIIYRSDMQEEEISLQIKKQEEDWKDINITLYPKEYSEKELEELFVKACDILPQLMSKKEII